MNSTDETISFFLYCWMQMNLNDGRCATCATILLFGNGAERHGHTVEKNDVTAERPRAASLHLRLSETNKSVAALSLLLLLLVCWSALFFFSQVRVRRRKPRERDEKEENKI